MVLIDYGLHIPLLQKHCRSSSFLVGKGVGIGVDDVHPPRTIILGRDAR